MHLESLSEQVVSVAGTSIGFSKGETIHTENSYKHAIPALHAMAREAGWEVAQMWTDDAGLFGVHALT